MRLTKFAHACVLVEDEDNTILFDPGQFSWESGIVQLDKWEKVDFICITHEHFDHFSVPFVTTVVEKFPDAKILTTESAVRLLEQEGVQRANVGSSIQDIHLENLEHESMAPLTPDPNVQNVAIHYKNLISHPGDSYHLDRSGKILFLPLAGPWGAAIDGIRMAEKLKPEVIVPVHDWMWNDAWRKSMYDRIESYFSDKGVKFLKPIDGQAIEIEL